MATLEQTKVDINGIERWALGLCAEGRSEDAIASIVAVLRTMCQEVTELRTRLGRVLREQYGRKSEGISTAQLDLFLRAIGEAPVDAAQDANRDATAPADTAAPTSEGERAERKRSRHGRGKLPEDLPRVRKDLRVSEEERTCPECGEARKCIGHEESEVLEYVPGHFEVHVMAREKLACPKGCDGVVVASVADKVIEGGLPGPGLITEIAVNKYCEHMPVHRQAQRFERMGVELSRSTMTSWCLRSADLLKPLHTLLGERVLGSFLHQTDPTALKILDRDHPAGVRKGSLWCHIGDSRWAYFEHAPDQSRDGPFEYLRRRHGYLQADGSNLFDPLFAAPVGHAVEVGCWMHARRKFFKALEAGDHLAAVPLRHIKAIYRLEAKLQADGADAEAVHAAREAHARPEIQALGAWARDRQASVAPKLPLGKAIGYLIRQWAALGRYLEDGRLPIDNGAVERLIRSPALGRKNWLFAGSDEGARAAAVYYSLFGTCYVNGVNPRAYLRDVLEKLAAGWPMARLAELLPDAWVAAHPNVSPPLLA